MKRLDLEPRRMKIEWSELEAYGLEQNTWEKQDARRTGVPAAITGLFSRWLIPRQEAFRKLAESLLFEWEPCESAPYAARVMVDQLKAEPGRLNLQVLWILGSLCHGSAWGATVKHGPFKGRLIDQLCREIVGELLPLLERARTRAGGQEAEAIQDLLDTFEDRNITAARPYSFWTPVVHYAIAWLCGEKGQVKLEPELKRVFGLTLSEEGASDEFLNKISYGLDCAARGGPGPPRDSNFLAWTSYEKAIADPAIISRLCPKPREIPKVPWVCPGCTETLEWQFRSCWKCGTPRPETE